MGYLIGGAGEGPEQEIVASDASPYASLSNKELANIHKKTINDISKYNNFQMARKIALNSAYGAIGNQYFRYYKLANAEAITLSGQTSIRWIENRMNGYLNNLLKTEDVVGEITTKSWEEEEYGEYPLVGVLTFLNQTRLNVRTAEDIMLELLEQKTGE